jgi:hypothetical protein
MNDEHSQTTLVKTSNIGFALGILVVVALGMFLFKSDFISQRFGQKSVVESTPTPSVAPVAVEDEPITLLDEVAEDTRKSESEKTEKPVVYHEPVDTAIGDSPMYLLSLLLGSAGTTYFISKKLDA